MSKLSSVEKLIGVMLLLVFIFLMSFVVKTPMSEPQRKLVVKTIKLKRVIQKKVSSPKSNRSYDVNGIIMSDNSVGIVNYELYYLHDDDIFFCDNSISNDSPLNLKCMGSTTKVYSDDPIKVESML